MRALALISLCLGLASAQGTGIQVRFLSNPPGDSVSKYAVYRSTTSASYGTKVGEVPHSDKDTLAFDDLQAARGTAYYYSITAITQAGLESDFSAQTMVAQPDLELAPSLLSDLTGGGRLRFVLPAAAHPLKGHAPLEMVILGDSPFNLSFNEAASAAELTAKTGKPDSGAVRIQVSYFGTFQDVDTVRIVLRTPLAAPIWNRIDGAVRAEAVSGRNMAGLRFHNLPARGSIDLLGLAGELLASKDIQGLRDGVFPLDPGRISSGACLFRVLDPAGRFQAAGRIPLSR